MSSQDYQAQAASYSFTSSSNYTSTTQNGTTTTTGTRNATYAATDPSTGGTTIQSASQNYGEPVVGEVRRFGPDGRELPAVEGETRSSGEIERGTMGTSNNRVEDVTESEADREYRERMEDEYAKREGGA